MTMSREKREASYFPASVYIPFLRRRVVSCEAQPSPTPSPFGASSSCPLESTRGLFPRVSLSRDEKRYERKSYDASTARHLPKCVYFSRDNDRRETIKSFFSRMRRSWRSHDAIFVELTGHKWRSSSRVFLTTRASLKKRIVRRESQ